MTEAEKRLWKQLRAHGFKNFSFRRQAPIGPYIVDFICLEARLVIELDGGQHSENVKDRRRDGWLRSQEFQILRFWNNDVLCNLAGVLEIISDALDRKSPPSPTLPRKGGGSTSARGDRHAT